MRPRAAPQRVERPRRRVVLLATSAGAPQRQVVAEATCRSRRQGGAQTLQASSCRTACRGPPRTRVGVTWTGSRSPASSSLTSSAGSAPRAAAWSAPRKPTGSATTASRSSSPPGRRLRPSSSSPNTVVVEPTQSSGTRSPAARCRAGPRWPSAAIEARSPLAAARRAHSAGTRRRRGQSRGPGDGRLDARGGVGAHGRLAGSRRELLHPGDRSPALRRLDACHCGREPRAIAGVSAARRCSSATHSRRRARRPRRSGCRTSTRGCTRPPRLAALDDHCGARRARGDDGRARARVRQAPPPPRPRAAGPRPDHPPRPSRRRDPAAAPPPSELGVVTSGARLAAAPSGARSRRPGRSRGARAPARRAGRRRPRGRQGARCRCTPAWSGARVPRRLRARSAPSRRRQAAARARS